MSSRTGHRALRLVAVCLLVGLVAAASAAPASAHVPGTSAVLLDVGPASVTGQVQLPVDRLAIAVEDPTLTAARLADPTVMERLRGYVQDHTAAAGADGTPWTTTVDDGRVESIDGIDHLVLDLALVPPPGQVDPTASFTLSYDAVVEHLLSHQVLVAARTAGDDGYTTVGLLTWKGHDVAVEGLGPGSRGSGQDLAASGGPAGFLAGVRLGVEHITGGADHLLFLVTLLVPAPLVAAGGRWVPRADLRRAGWRVVHVVTAFAVGHSLTLALAASGLVQVSTRLVESLIAVSILAAAVHAIRPLVPGGEALIAAGFGLVHGLAFAALVSELGLGRTSLVVDLLGFNLGIELTQLLVVALLMPSLLLLSRTRVYPFVRVAGAVGAGVLACAWLAERTGLVSADPFAGLTDAALRHSLVGAGVLAAAAVACRLIPRLRLPGPVDARGQDPTGGPCPRVRTRSSEDMGRPIR